MKNLKILTLLLVLPLLVVLNACKESVTEPEPEQINEAQVLLQYLEANGDYVNSTSCPSIISAADVRTLQLTNPSKLYVIDIRAAADFTNGRIEGAKNVAVADLLTHMKSINAASYDRIVIVCYSGQTSGFAVGLLRLMGYNNVFSLKWGMSSWASTFAENYWKKNISNARAAEFVSTPTPKGPTGNLPTITTGKTTGAEILEARVSQLLAEGFAATTINQATLFSNLSNYYIVNYWPAAQYADPGHIPGAIQYEPRVDLKSTTNLKTLPTNKTIVVYCYTGQTSAFVASAFLRLLGYDAKSLLYGANAMIYDRLVAKNMNPWLDSEIKNYPYVSGP